MKPPRRKQHGKAPRKDTPRSSPPRTRPQRSFALVIADLADLPPDTPELSHIFDQVMQELRLDRRGVWSLGLLYRELKKGGAAERAHFESAEQWWQVRLESQITLKTVRKYMMLVRELEQRATVDFSSECLFLYCRWCHKTKHPVARYPADEMIPVIQDGKVVKKRFADCTERDMKSALHALAYKKDPGMGLPPQLTKFVDYADSNLGDVGGDEAHKLEGYMLGKEPRVRLDFSVYDLVAALQSILKSTQGFPLFSEQDPADDPDADGG